MFNDGEMLPIKRVRTPKVKNSYEGESDSVITWAFVIAIKKCFSMLASRRTKWNTINGNVICFVYFPCLLSTLYRPEALPFLIASLRRNPKTKHILYFTTYTTYINCICIKLSEDQKMIITKSIQDKEELFEISDWPSSRLNSHD